MAAKTARSIMSVSEKRQWALVLLAVITLLLSAGWQSYQVGTKIESKVDKAIYDEHVSTTAYESGVMSATLTNMDKTLTEIKDELKEYRNARQSH